MAERDICGTTLEGHIFIPGARKAPAEILTTPAIQLWYNYIYDKSLQTMSKLVIFTLGSTWLIKYEKLAGAVRISAGDFLAPGQKICPSSVPRVPQMSLSATVLAGNVIIGLHG